MAAEKSTGAGTGAKTAEPAQRGDVQSVVAEAHALLAESSRPQGEALHDPIAFIQNDHVRQLRMCNLLDAFTDRLEVSPVASLAGALLQFLKTDLPSHTADEEADLFPALRRRCLQEDGIEEVLRQLSREHELDGDLIDFMVDDLEILADGGTLSNPVRLLMNVREFAEMQRRHLTWENRVILPLARNRLTPDDLAAIGRNMAERRGLGQPDQG